jgi:UDPglucose--hexose-1-phosphate uridylyltransferase
MRERRYDPTSDEWVTFSSDRQDRTYKPRDACPLCPTLPGGPETEIPLPAFEVVTFDNRFPAFSADAPAPEAPGPGLYRSAPATGRCEVVVYSDDHFATFADLPLTRIRMIIDVWADRWRALAAEAAVGYVMPFENKGEVVGTTLSHPHGQIYAFPDVPPRPQRELTTARRYRQATGRCIRCDVIQAEISDGRRLVATTDSWIGWVPFWARFPYEVQVAPRRHVPSLPDLTVAERDDLAVLLSVVTRSYDALWNFAMPYVMVIHQQPTTGDPQVVDVSHLRFEFAPPYRSRDRLKHVAGAELGAGAFISDAAPEATALALRAARDRLAGRGEPDRSQPDRSQPDWSQPGRSQPDGGEHG